MITQEEILEAIRREVEDRKAYLDPKLTLVSLSQRCETNRTYVSSLLTAQLGGFFTYINRHRLAHAAVYKEQHPGASIDEIAKASGFRNRQTYYNALHRLEECDQL